MDVDFQRLNSGVFSVPLQSRANSNVSALIGHEPVLRKWADEHPHLFDEVLRFMQGHPLPKEWWGTYTYHGPESEDSGKKPARGRKPGSTNWTAERFWRKYRLVASDLKKPYRRTHLAAGIGLTYATFMKYLAMWGPPTGFRGPGE